MIYHIYIYPIELLHFWCFTMLKPRPRRARAPSGLKSETGTYSVAFDDRAWKVPPHPGLGYPWGYPQIIQVIKPFLY